MNKQNLEKKISAKVFVEKRPLKENKTNRFFLIIFIVMLLQSVIMIYLAYNLFIVVPKSDSQIKSDLNISSYQLSKRIDLVTVDLKSQINKLSTVLLKTQTDLGKQISTIQAKTSSDFSGIIQSAVISVVSIKTDIAQGTGFIITSNGYVVTNAHVLSGAKYAEAITSDQNTNDLELIGYNITTDIALLKLKENHDYLELRDSNNINVGEKVIAIGNPLGLGFSVSEGIVSAVNREGSNGMNAYIQTDAALNPGNSGGPLIGTDGKVIGINNFKARGESIGFALESNYIKDSVNEIALDRLNRTILN